MNATPSRTVSSDDDLSMAVIDLVASATDTDPLELDPLYNAINPEALDSLTDSPAFSTFEFEYAGHTVVVERVGDELELSLEPVTIGAGGSSSIADSEPSA